MRSFDPSIPTFRPKKSSFINIHDCEKFDKAGSQSHLTTSTLKCGLYKQSK